MIDGVRFASTPEEIKASYQLRYQIYIEEMGRLREKGDSSVGELRDLYDESAKTVVAIKNNKAVGTLRILWGGDTDFDDNLVKTYNMSPFFKYLKKDEICIVERLMVDKDHRGSSTMLRLYKETLRFIIDNKIELLLLASVPSQASHYQKLGGHVFAKPYLYAGIGPTLPIAQAMGDYDYMQDIRSPFAMLTKHSDWQHFEKAEIINGIIEREQEKAYRNAGKHKSVIDSALAFQHRQSSRPDNKLRFRIGAA